ncbi:hypothetical protein QFW77_18715 [Luteimonas sp. RD2P54]|uniref:Cardiolipin synthase N-terminal domain-containing protein n=1 Tax=Luteimonas endophytica TaxID=3042023 RepID=A0ABT6JE50_9GAMM|nr:hypothetical protein [Luteimonas endophytica]MDH5825004.1 hypothetical protein [Luteimonas endophytica]
MDWTIVALLALLALNAFASVAVLRDPVATGGRRTAQLAIVWLVPVVGAVVCAAVVSVHARDERPVPTPPPFADGAGGGQAHATTAAGDCGGFGADGGGCGGD